MGGREPVGAAGMTVKRGPKWPWFSALRGPESGLAGKMKQIEAPNRGTKSRHQIEAPNRGTKSRHQIEVKTLKNTAEPRKSATPPRARARAFYRRKIGCRGLGCSP